jgi:hypothetical protein
MVKTFFAKGKRNIRAEDYDDNEFSARFPFLQKRETETRTYKAEIKETIKVCLFYLY